MIVKAAIVKCNLPSHVSNQGLGAQLRILLQVTRGLIKAFAQVFLNVLFNDFIDYLTHSSQIKFFKEIPTFSNDSVHNSNS